MALLPSIHDSSTISSQQSTDIGGMVSTIVFGLAACVIGIITIWQGYKAWIIWRPHGAPAGLPNEHMLSITAVELGSSPPLHNVGSTPHNTDEEHLAADRDEELTAQNNDEGQYAATPGEGSPLPGPVSHGILAAQDSAGDEPKHSQVVSTGEV